LTNSGENLDDYQEPANEWESDDDKQSDGSVSDEDQELNAPNYEMHNYLENQAISKQFTVFDDLNIDIKDPFALYGTGILAHFLLQRDLIRLFFILTLCSIPMLLIYSGCNGLSAYE